MQFGQQVIIISGRCNGWYAGFGGLAVGATVGMQAFLGFDSRCVLGFFLFFSIMNFVFSSNFCL